MRLFIAVGPSPAVTGAVGRLVAALLPLEPRAGWLRPSDAHLTLAFLGEVGSERLGGVEEAMAEAAAAAAPFRATLGGIGAFPSWRAPRVVWLGVREGERPLAELASSLRTGLGRRGFEPQEREFHPHLTLCRLKPGRRPERLRETLEGLDFSASMEVSEFSLYRSRLSPAGAEHVALRAQAVGRGA